MRPAVASTFHVVVHNLPAWLDWQRLVGPGDWAAHEAQNGWLTVEAELSRDAAADLAVRLRGVGIGGRLLQFETTPTLRRKELRQANTDEARRRREGSTGFSKSGTRVDQEGKISLTPETLAFELGQRAGNQRVIDAFAGAGGNAIGFARAGCAVTAIELDAERLAMARHNAGRYGVSDRIKFIHGDARTLVPELEADLIFLDPPWGEDYDRERVTLGGLPPCAKVLEASSHIKNRWIKVPPSFDPGTLPDCQPQAFFGVGAGDDRRVKFLLLKLS
ncbi:MAG: RsmD family RNA methyltransferase [Verrucomicrobiota bacterium]